MNKVQYDKNGNIVIAMQQDTTKQIESIGGVEWNVTKKTTEHSASTPAIQEQKKPSFIHKIIQRMTAFYTRPSKEIYKQVQYSQAEFKAWQEKLTADTRKNNQSFWQTMHTPVWLLRKNKPPKQYNRLQLFVADTFRFGATFGLIFGVLFVGLNYESFWVIAKENINPIASAQKEIELTKHIGSVLGAETTNRIATTQKTKSIGDPLAHLPAVGPPENRLIIPSLGLNVPLATPVYEALLSEDWTQLEKDIQAALELGVVHYPGTARPGQAGNFFVTGHSSYYAWAPGKYKSVFSKLSRLNIGDEYFVYYGGDKHRYVITEKKEVRPNNVDVLDQPLNKRISTLMTCTPVGTTLRRLILVAQEIDPITGELMEVGEDTAEPVQNVRPQMLPI